MIIKIDIQNCGDCPFHDEEWGCNFIDYDLAKECPFDTENEVVIIKKEG